MPIPVLVLIAVLAVVPSAAAQPGPHVSALAGLSAGDGGPAPAAAAVVGWMTSHGIGFEVELAIAPGLDLTPDRDSPRIADPVFSIFPRPTFESSGRLLTFQTNARVSTGWRGRWNMTAIGGGGVANLRQRTNLGYPNIGYPTDLFVQFESLGLLPPFGLEWIEREITSSESALCLNAGGLVEFAVTKRSSAGVDARYLHAFFGAEGLHTARILGRVSWRF